MLLISFIAVTQQPLIKPLGHHELLLVLLELAVLLLVARGLGEVFRRFQQPPVVGELLAGVLLGPSLLGAILPNLQSQIFPKTQLQSDLLSVVSWLGVLFLLIVTGLETDLNLIVRKGRTALLISIGGIIVPFITGLGLGWLLPAHFLINPNQRLIFSLFIATAMSISAVPVIAKVLMDLKLIRRDIGQITLAAGMTDDTLGWILLSVVAGLASSERFDLRAVAQSIGGAVVFLGFALTVGRSLMSRVLRWVDNYIGGATASISALLVLAFGAAALTHFLGIEAALGAFVTGILAGRSPRFSREARVTLEQITAGFLAPIFFATAGLKVNLIQLLTPQVLVTGLIVLGIACFGKFTGAYIGSRVGGLRHWEGIALGAGMNARGAMEIIVATIGVSLGVLNQPMYSIIVMVAIVTSLMAPPLLRWSLSHVTMSDEEADRLEQEALIKRSFIKRIHRVLLPFQPDINSQLSAQLVGCLAHQNLLEVTALHLSEDRPSSSAVATSIPALSDRRNGVEQLQLPTDTVLHTKTKITADPTASICQEANRGYDLVVLSAPELVNSQTVLFHPTVDRVIQQSPCPTLVVQSKRHYLTLGQPYSIRRILVPTNGSVSSEHALEVASTIAAQTNAIVTLVSVVDRLPGEYRLLQERPIDSVTEIAHRIVEQQATIARELGAKVRPVVLTGIPEFQILEFTRQERMDLLVLGSHLQSASGRVFFGQRIDTILSMSSCPVLMLALPSKPTIL